MQSEKRSSSLTKQILQSILDASLIPFLAILTAVVVGGIIIRLVGGDPFRAYLGLIQGSMGSTKALSETAVWATPYIFAGLAVALAFKGGLFNIGAEGQLAVGAVFSALIGYALPEWLGYDLPTIIHLPLAVLVGMLMGGIWAGSAGPAARFHGSVERAQSTGAESGGLRRIRQVHDHVELLRRDEESFERNWRYQS